MLAHGTVEAHPCRWWWWWLCRCLGAWGGAPAACPPICARVGRKAKLEELVTTATPAVQGEACLSCSVVLTGGRRSGVLCLLFWPPHLFATAPTVARSSRSLALH